jgi:Tol biopolymer transport system component
MELVDGGPLSESIPKGGLPLQKLLRIAIEVADAMAAAQQRGITHRDVKPGNIMLTAGGRAKVLDFGLAKLHGATAAGDDVTRMSPANDVTGDGRIIGTVAYMSPEQAEGKPVDPRSDIFSLGVVLHEMATGDRPFKGDTNVSILSSILKDTPSPITDSNPELPADLARIVRRCLAKDPDRRYQSAADLRNELEELKQDTTSGTATMARPAARAKVSRAALIGGLAALTAVIAAAIAIGSHNTAASKEAAGFSIDRLQRLTTTGSAFLAAISPDGRYVVHVKVEDEGAGLWTRQTATSSDVRIVAPADVRFDGVAFSPDGNYVYYNAYPGTGGVASLYKVPVLGGTPVRLLEDIDSAVTFSPDQTQMAFTRGLATRGTTELLVAAIDGTGTRAIATAPAPDKFQSESPSWSADGTTILATALSSRPGIPSLVYAVDVKTGGTTTVGGAWGFVRDVRWLPDGRSFLATAVDLSGLASPQIWRIAYPSGERSRVTNDLNAYVGASLSADGRLLATVQTETTAGIYVTRGPTEEPLQITRGVGRADGVGGITWLPDGRIVYTSTASGLPQLWIADDGGNQRQITSMPGPVSFPWSAPDGKWIYFTGYAKAGVSLSLFRVAPDGSGLQQLTSDGDARNAVVSRDGKTLYFTAMKTGTPRLMKVSSEGGTPEEASSQYFRVHDISFDGGRLAGIAWSEEGRRAMLALLNLKDGSIRLLPDYPTSTLFMPDGSFGAVQRIQGKSVLTARLAAGGGPRPLSPPIPDTVFAGAVSRDGRVAFARGQSVSDVVLITAKQEKK